MSFRSQVLAVVMLGAVSASAQIMASHHATEVAKQRIAQQKAAASAAAPTTQISALAKKPVVRVNGAVLSELDLIREMNAIFPYANQHNGIPKDMEPEIRKGALDMIIFEELLYQEAKRRNLQVSVDRMNKSESSLRKKFPTQQAYDEYLKAEMKGDKAVLREKIRRSLLIEQMLKTEVSAKSEVSAADAKAYYLKNAKQFEHGETFRIQTISIIPPSGGAEIKKEARKRAEDAAKAAKTAKTYQEFGLLAEKWSDDDWHVNMGDRKDTEIAKLPPEVVKLAKTMKPGEVSGLIQIGDCYTIFRVVSHTPAGKKPFADVQKELQTNLHKQKTQEVRSALGAKLRKNAKVEIL